jgi:Uma2 family endonuclease
MSSVVPPEQTLEPDPWRYGWRYVRRTRPDGTEELDQVPLTLEDVLHPQEGDQVVENSRHERHRRHFQDVFERRLARQPTRLNLSDCLIDWDRADLRGHCPDLIVLERDEPWPWATWSTLHARAEGARPQLIIEIVSPSTRNNDVVIKVEHYHRAGVPLYVILDEEEEDGPLRLLGYQYAPEAYVPFEPDEQGRLFLEPLGLYLTVQGDRVAIFDAATGQEQGNYVAVCEALEAEVKARDAAELARDAAELARDAAELARDAAAKAQAAAEARQREEARARQSAEERERRETEARQAAEQARQEAERRAGEQAEARQAAERARTELERRAREEAQARQAVESRLKELEAELQRLRGPAQ